MTDTANGATMMPDELRDAIDEYCARDPADIFREALEHTIEERNALIDMCNELKAENAKLRQQLADVTESMGRMEERCAKLRELVRDMWDWLAPIAVGGGVPMKGLHSRIHKLGVEVE